MQSYEYINHTADIGMRAYGSSLGELIEHAGEGFSDLITERAKINVSLERHIAIEQSSIDSLLVSWLNELNYLFEMEKLLFERFLVEIRSDNSMDARCFGEKYDPERHEIKTIIKAVTYHQLRVEMREDVWEAFIIFDI